MVYFDGFGSCECLGDACMALTTHRGMGNFLGFVSVRLDIVTPLLGVGDLVRFGRGYSDL